MSLSTFIKLATKAFKYTISRPMQRFNIENRAVKYLGPDARKWNPSPRALGPISRLSHKELPRYPHLNPGYKSISHKRSSVAFGEKKDVEVPKALKSYSEDETDDNLVIEASNKLDVVKTVAKVELPPPPEPQSLEQIECSETTTADETAGGQLSKTTGPSPSHRPLPKSTDLQLQDLRSIWEVERTPPGRLNLNMLQEMMINKLADHDNWTPKAIAERYQIREEYAEKLISHLKQIRIRLSPRMYKNVDYTGMNNPQYKAAKHIIFHMDKSLRSDYDRKFDSMYLPNENLPDDVKEIIDPPGTVQLAPQQGLHADTFTVRPKRFARPAPLRIAPANLEKSRHSSQRPAGAPLIEQIDDTSTDPNREVKKLEAPKRTRFSSND